MAFATRAERYAALRNGTDLKFVVQIVNKKAGREDELIADDFEHGVNLCHHWAKFCNKVQMFRVFCDGSLNPVNEPIGLDYV